jgi:sugar lactone lactonase YvrE
MAAPLRHLWRCGVLLSIGLLTCCAFAPTDTVPQRSSAGALVSRVHGTAQKQWFLYLGGAEGSLAKFTVYRLGGSRPVRSFKRSWNVYAMTLDPWGDVYTTNNLVSGGEITAYTPGGKGVLVDFGFNFPKGLAFDKHGNLWVANTVAIGEFAARSTRRLRYIKTTRGCYALAIDSSDNVYAACGGNARKNEIEVFAPRARSPFRAITQGIDKPNALMFDHSGNLFVENCSPCDSYGKKHGGSISVYVPGSGVPSRTITNGIDWPIAMAFDGEDKLAVANSPWLEKGSVMVYGSGSNPTHTITKGIRSPDAIATDPNGNVYVSNLPVAGGKYYSITVYSANGSLLRTITDGVEIPSALAIGSD